MSRIPEILRSYQTEILDDWVRQQVAGAAASASHLRESEVRERSLAFLNVVREAFQSGSTDPSASPWAPVRSFISELSFARARQGVSASQTAWFIFSLKLPIFSRLR